MTYIKILSLAVLLLNSCWIELKAQQVDDSLKVAKLEKIGIITPSPVLKFQKQSDAVSFAELLPGAAGVHVTETGVIGAACFND
ncbi:hypothetical protein [Niabella ginsengisoli]|uniref:Uncharacterized protein n=1 Tax=Niabella ginsengisoli TaxID=522298 RepID=A0ABS9SNV0_9BACT|nr:hypothetical protein [Niabella ginsengisoli]MCH5599824.1 hypothetical protein [Niabella ginsengisoli]